MDTGILIWVGSTLGAIGLVIGILQLSSYLIKRKLYVNKKETEVKPSKPWERE